MSTSLAAKVRRAARKKQIARAARAQKVAHATERNAAQRDKTLDPEKAFTKPADGTRAERRRLRKGK